MTLNRRDFIRSAGFALPILSDLRAVGDQAVRGAHKHAEGDSSSAAGHICISGLYPHLALYNDELECGIGAIVPWADRLWVVTYAPHKPSGSSDKLYEIDGELRLAERIESIGGTPANRMVHRESNQLFIGPYAISGERLVRVIPYAQMFGRPTGNARHLVDPASKIYYASMEEALYEVDVHTLEVTTLYYDEALEGKTPKANLPGYHGKGLYSGQGRVVYSNNGERGAAAQRDPATPSGVLAEWDGRNWRIVMRAQFTEVTGPGGIYGNQRPESDPIWAIGWDVRSLILMVLDDGTWRCFRLPKASHSYDGAHGWNTEWPRIRDVGETDLLMTMHGMFWRFPRTFCAANSAGIRPRSTYLKVVGDFCRWQDHIVCGCDDAARSQFLNASSPEAPLAAPQSHSNLWFLEPDELDQLGPLLGRGSVWLREDVAANAPSDPFLFEGYPVRMVHLCHDGSQPATVTIQVDRTGSGAWVDLAQQRLEPRGYACRTFDAEELGVWIRLKSDAPLQRATASFHYRDDDRSVACSAKFDGLATVDDPSATGGPLWASDDGSRTLYFAARQVGSDGKAVDVGLYQLDAGLRLRRVDDGAKFQWLMQPAAIPSSLDFLEVDSASAVYTDASGKRFRLPKGNSAFDHPGFLGPERALREVVTERNLFNYHGAFYELPAENAGGIARIRPIGAHNFRITDFCSYRGLLVASGVSQRHRPCNPHIVRSDDGRTALWIGAIDDLWGLGRPTGRGGPWNDTKVQAGAPSDPYLMTDYYDKTLILSHDQAGPLEIYAEVDFTGEGDWVRYGSWDVPAGEQRVVKLPQSFQAYWIRLITSANAVVTGELEYA